jgi:hypothetical protein
LVIVKKEISIRNVYSHFIGTTCAKAQILWMAVAVLLFWAQHASATSVVLVEMTNSYIVACDSLVVGTEGPYQTCKLRTSGTTVIVCSGLYRLKDDGFLLSDIAESAMKEKMFDQVVDTFIKRVIDRLGPAIATHQQRTGSRRYIKNPRVITALVVSIVNSRPRCVRLAFESSDLLIFGPTISCHREDVIAPTNPSQVRVVPLGTKDVIAPVLKEGKVWICSSGIMGSRECQDQFAGVATALVAKEENAHPLAVGGKISSIVVDASGIRWLNVGECKNQSQKKPAATHN